MNEKATSLEYAPNIYDQNISYLVLYLNSNLEITFFDDTRENRRILFSQFFMPQYFTVKYLKHSYITHIKNISIIFHTKEYTSANKYETYVFCCKNKK